MAWFFALIQWKFLHASSVLTFHTQSVELIMDAEIHRIFYTCSTPTLFLTKD